MSNLISKSHPHLREQFLYCLDKNGNKDQATTFNVLMKNSNRRALWKCPNTTCEKKCKHIYQTGVQNKTRSNPTGCPFCSGRTVCPCNSLLAKHPELAKEWGENNTLKPFEVAEKSGKMIQWKCSHAACDHHVWITSPSHRVGNKSGCPYCSKNKICICDSLAKKRPEWLKEWCTENIVKPTEIGESSHYIIQWKCTRSKCDHHVWKMSPSDRVQDNSNCPFCAGRQFCECYCLASVFPDLLNSEWDEYKNDEEGLDIFKLAPYSNKYAWWICESCKFSWKCPINSRTSMSTGCPSCRKSHMEKDVIYLLKLLTINKKIQDFELEKLLHDTKLRADFWIVLNDECIILEMDGLQHFEPVNFGSKTITKEAIFQKTQDRDKRKKEWCENNNIRLLRISYLVKPEDYEAELLDFFQNKNVTFRLVGQPPKKQ